MAVVLKTRLLLETGPHQKAYHDTPSVMRQVVLALSPALISGLVLFRVHALLVMAVCAAGALAGEALVLKVRNRPLDALKDASALLSGLLLACTLPPQIPLWCAFIGAFFATALAKQVFGGLGQNVFNPALAGRAFLMAAFPSLVSAPDSIGTMWVIATAVGGAYLLLRQIADWRVPLGMFLGMMVPAGLWYIQDQANGSIVTHLFTGGFTFAMFFMAADPVTTPMSRAGRLIFGIGAGALTVVLRHGPGAAHSVWYAVLCMNALVPLIDRYIRPRPFGAVKSA
jgi:electron transport complex protein RnfD